MGKKKIVRWQFKFTFSITLNEGNMKWIIARMFEPSSWAGIGTIVMVIEQVSKTGAITEAGMSAIITALVAIFMKEKKLVDAPQEASTFPAQPKKAID
jgi:hypothetical protein